MAAILAALAPRASAQRQFDELSKRDLPLEADGTRGMQFGDVDGDGDLDLVVANSGSQNRLYLNENGVFVDATVGRMPGDADVSTAVALGDVDGDGDLDIVIANTYFLLGQPNRMYLNDGTGLFVAAAAGQIPSVAKQTTSLALADFDGDGDLDIVVGNSTDLIASASNELWINDGSGNFADATAGRLATASSNTLGIGVGDVDGDGDVDLLFANNVRVAGAQNQLFLNDGAGTFTDGTGLNLPLAADFSTAIALGDLDGDGDLDALVGSGSSAFGGGPPQSQLLLNNGAGVFVNATATGLPVDTDVTAAVGLADVDGDGDLDAVLGKAGGRNRLYINSGAAAFSDGSAAGLPADAGPSHAVALGDVDGDGDVDLVVGNSGSQNRLYINGGLGRFEDIAPGRLPFGSGRRAVLGDVDGDGDLDRVVARDGQNWLQLNDGRGGFVDATATHFPILSDATLAVALGDLDGDGDLDVVTANAGQNRIALNDGAGGFADVTAARMPLDTASSMAVALGDVDGDGDLDIAFGNTGGRGAVGQDTLYLNNGAGVFTDVTSARLPVDFDQTISVALGDIDADGDLDLILGSDPTYYPSQNRIYLNGGAGSFTDETAARLPAVNQAATVDVLVGDVDDDGDLDIVFANAGSCSRVGGCGGAPSELLLNDGAGVFASAAANQMPAFFLRIAGATLADVDDDGDLDLVQVGATSPSGPQWSGPQWLYLNDGSGVFADASGRLASGFEPAFGVAAGDLDGDGDLDLTTTGWVQDRVYFNLQRQIAVPFSLRVGRPLTVEVYARFGAPRLFDVAVPFLSAGTASIPVPGLGTVGIDLGQAISLPPFVIPASTGVGSTTLGVPNDPTLVGLSIYGQALLVQYPLGDHLTNVSLDVLRR